MFNERYITPEERNLIKEARSKEKQYSDYLRGAVKRMETPKPAFKIKVYKDKN